MNEIEKAKSIIKLINDSDINSTFLLGWQIEFIEKLCRKQLNNGWIPCSERLPTKEEFNKNDGRFIVTDGMRRYQSLFDIYEGKNFVDITYLGNCNFKETVDKCVIAWQPMPEPYKPKED